MTVAGSDSAAPRYRFAGQDGAVWLGLRVVPLAALAAGVVLAVGGLYLGFPVPVAVLVLVAGVVLASVPIAGQRGAEWLGPLTRRATSAATSADRWSTNPCGALAVASSSSRVLRLPREYGRLRLLDAEGGAVGVVDDAAARAYTVVLAVAGVDRFTLMDPGEQAARLSGWGNALSGLAADPDIRRIQWVERAGPDRRDATAWLRERAATRDDADAVDDYAALATRLSSAARRHEVWLAVQLSRRSGGSRTGGRAAVGERVREVMSALLAADLVARPLPVAELGWLLRRFVDHQVGPVDAEPLVGQLGPSSRRTGWAELRTDDSWHRSFAIAGWPRVPVPASWLEPLLAGWSPPAVRTLSLHLQPVPPPVAAREARAARTRARLDRAERLRLGLTDAPAIAWAETDAEDTEQELLAGYRLHRVAGVISCTAGDLAGLDEACRSVRAAAAAARVDLRPMHGQHDVGLLASLPLCRVDGRAS